MGFLAWASLGNLGVKYEPSPPSLSQIRGRTSLFPGSFITNADVRPAYNRLLSDTLVLFTPTLAYLQGRSNVCYVQVLPSRSAHSVALAAKAKPTIQKSNQILKHGYVRLIAWTPNRKVLSIGVISVSILRYVFLPQPMT